eukprot:scaffold117386_cov39-Tisochrysis_lutea.AAC.2
MLFHPVKNRSCIFDYWNGAPISKAALDPARYKPMNTKEVVDVERLVELVDALGLGGDDFDA